MKVVRLLLLTAEPWPTFRADVAVLFGRYLPRLGVAADLVALQSDAAGPDWSAGQAWLRKPGMGAARRHLWSLLHGARGLLRLRTGVHEALQVRDMPMLAALGLLVARVRGLPFFYWMSYPIPEGHLALARTRGLQAGVLRAVFPWLRGYLGFWLLYRWVLPRADHVFVQSEHMRQGLAARGLAQMRMTAVPMGVDFEAVARMDGQPADEARFVGRRVLVYLGTLDAARNLETLFEMLALVRKREPAALLLMVGDTADVSQRRVLHDAALAAGVSDHVVWTGWLSTAAAWRHVRAADVALSPVPRGPLMDCSSPTKICEYLALGVPVVANDNPDQAALMQDGCGGLCVEYTALAFASAALSLLSLTPQERTAMVMRGAARVRAQRDYGVLAAALAARYSDLLTGQRLAVGRNPEREV